MISYSPGLAACDDPVSVAASQVPLFSRSATLSRPQPRGRCYRQVRLCTRVISSWWIQARPHPRCNFLPEARSHSENESTILFEFITEEWVWKKRGELELIFLWILLFPTNSPFIFIAIDFSCNCIFESAFFLSLNYLIKDDRD